MITLKLPVPLARFMPDPDQPDHLAPRSVLLAARSWAEFIDEIRERFPLLAERVLTASETLASGFLLVINDEALTANGAAGCDFQDGDEISLIAALAGG